MILITVIIICLILYLWIFKSTILGAPYLPSDIRKIIWVFDWLKLQPDQLVIDLGAGDGRIIILASLLYGAKSIGVEIDLIRHKFSKFLILLVGLKEKSKAVRDDIYNFDLSNADVVMIYLLPASIQRLRPKLESELCVGSKIVSFQFPIPYWNVSFINEKKQIFIYKYEDNLPINPYIK